MENIVISHFFEIYLRILKSFVNSEGKMLITEIYNEQFCNIIFFA